MSITIKDVPWIIEGDQCNVNYILEGNTDLITDEIIEKLKITKMHSYCNDTTNKSWIWPVEIDGVYFESTSVFEGNHEITFTVFKF